jgi:hypothetical protein
VLAASSPSISRVGVATGLFSRFCRRMRFFAQFHCSAIQDSDHRAACASQQSLTAADIPSSSLRSLTIRSASAAPHARGRLRFEASRLRRIVTPFADGQVIGRPR